jgi:hypothetical protein
VKTCAVCGEQASETTCPNCGEASWVAEAPKPEKKSAKPAAEDK